MPLFEAIGTQLEHRHSKMKSEELSKYEKLVVQKLRDILLAKHGVSVDGGKELVLQEAARFDCPELNEIAFALRRIEKGIYGQCVICRHEIPSEVLESNLTARLCPSCQTAIHEKSDTAR